MIVLHHCTGARSFRPLWTLEEMGLPYELKVWAFPPRIFDKSYLEVNPLGTVPFMTDHDATMTESAAICEYLVTRYGPSPLAVDVADKDYPAWLNWLHFGEATLTFPQTLVLRYTRLEPPERRQTQVVEDYTKWFHGRLRGIEAALLNRETLCAGRFTAADISVGYALMLAQMLGLSSDFTPNVAAYWARLQRRPAYQSALEAQKAATIKA